MDKVSSVILGAAGEHYVMAELLRRDIVAAKAPEGVPNFDIVITDLEGKRLAALQVKTRRDFKGGDRGWHMKRKHETLSVDQMFYIFVDLGRDLKSQVTFYILPARIVAHACSTSHKIWLDIPNARGAQHKDSDMRRLLPHYELPNYARKAGFIPPPYAAEFYKTHSHGWMECYKNAWKLITADIRG